MQKPPIEDVIKALVEAGLPADEIASTIARMFATSGDEIKKVADEVIPAPKSASVIPKLVEEGKPLPAAQKISAAEKLAKTPKFVRPKFDDVVHANTTEKYSDLMSKEQFDAAKDSDLKYIHNSTKHAYNTSQLPRPRAEKKAANKAAHAATRTPEARREAAAKQAEYFKNLKKGDK